MYDMAKPNTGEDGQVGTITPSDPPTRTQELFDAFPVRSAHNRRVLDSLHGEALEVATKLLTMSDYSRASRLLTDGRIIIVEDGRLEVDEPTAEQSENFDSAMGQLDKTIAEHGPRNEFERRRDAHNRRVIEAHRTSRQPSARTTVRRRMGTAASRSRSRSASCGQRSSEGGEPAHRADDDDPERRVTLRARLTAALQNQNDSRTSNGSGRANRDAARVRQFVGGAA